MIDMPVATPFGRRTTSLVMRSSDSVARSCPQETIADRWRLMKSLVTARQRLGLAAGALVVLEALLSCLPDTVMTPGQDLLVYPSNEQLSKRSKGMEPRSIRRHIAALVDAGLIVRRDSPNGKRFAVRARGGEVVEAYGFDLQPLLAQAAKITALAEEVDLEQRKTDALRRQITILRRYIRQAVALAYEQGLQGSWIEIETEFRPLSVVSLRSVSLSDAERLHTALRLLAIAVDLQLDSHSKGEKESANDGENDRHYLDSNTDCSIESEPAFEEAEAASVVADTPPIIQPRGGLPLALVLQACPDIADYAPDGISSWKDLHDVAALVRGYLGVSPSAWEEARTTLGDRDASITIAAILQRAAEIRSPGGYLRQLTSKAKSGSFTTGPIIMALVKRRARAA